MIIKSTIENGFPIVINLSENFPSDMISKVQAAANIMSIKLKSENIKKFIDDFSYPIFKTIGFWPFKKTVQTGSKNNFYIDSNDDIFNTTKDKILEIIQNANELVLNHGIDHEADLFIEMDNRIKSGVIGYTYPNIIKQWIYRNWLYNMTAYDLAGNFTHEWCHKIGGVHQFKNHSLRDYTPVYAIGYYASKL